MQVAGSEIQKKLLPQLDWIFPLLLAGATTFTLAVVLNALAGLWYTPVRGSTACLVINDSSTGVRGIPNCTCRKKAPESHSAEYRFNDCGYRTVLPCGAPKSGAYRIVLIGSSFGFGMWVDEENSFAALLPRDIAARTGRQVELFNASMQWGFPKSAMLRFHDALAQKPDLILWTLTPEDVSNSEFVLPATNASMGTVSSPLKKIRHSMLLLSDRGALEDKLTQAIRNKPLGILLQHGLFSSRSQYLSSYIAGSDHWTGFLKRDLSPQWQEYLKQFDADAATMEAESRAAGIPFVAVLLPSRAQVAMLASSDWPAGYDPYRLDRELRGIVTSHGGQYISILGSYTNLASPEKEYFPVDGHPDEQGHATIAKLLTNELTSGAIPQLAAGNLVVDLAERK